jgi:hypothetical protein
MAKVTPVCEEQPTLADIARGLNEVHRCVDGFRKDQEAVNTRAAGDRRILSRKISTMGRSVAAIKTIQDVDSGRITKLAKMFGAEKVKPGEKRPHGRGILTWGGWKLLGAAGGCIGLVVFLFQLCVAIAPAVFAYMMSLHP